MSLEQLSFKEIGNYVVLEHVNPERNSKTFKVKHKFTNEILALKIVVTDDDELISTLEKTFNRLSLGITKISNANLVKFKDYFVSEIEGHKYFVLVTEYFVGKELESFIMTGGGADLSYNERMDVYNQVCNAIQEAHTFKYQDEFGVEIEGFPHGAITPWNIMINNDLKLKVLDFKLSNRFTLSEEKIEYSKSIKGGKKDNSGISKPGDITQLGYLLHFLFSDSKKYSSLNLENSNLNEIKNSLEKSLPNKKDDFIAKIIFNSTHRESPDYFSTISMMTEAISLKPKSPKGVKLKKTSNSLVGILGLIGIVFGSFFIYKSTQQAPVEIAETRGTKPAAKKAAPVISSSGDYYALMIANENYKNLKNLSKPIKDVNTLKNILKTNYGFKDENIITKTNASRDDMYEGFERASQRVKKNDHLLIFYAGHGQLDGDTGYWIPVEGHETSRRNWISNSEIKKFLKSIAAQNVLIVSDACFGGSMLRSINSKNSKEGTISNKKTRIALTSGSLESVPDNSIFISQLFWFLENTQEEIVYASDIFTGIREGIVSNTTNDPGYGPIRDAGHQGGDFYFLKQNTVKTEVQE